MSFARIHLIFAPTRPHFYLLLSPYVLTKKMKRHGIVLGTWFDEKRISYLQMYHCMTYYILLDSSEQGESYRLIFSMGVTQAVFCD